MPEKEYQWLNISLYYSRRSWHSLLVDGLSPFLKSVRQDGSVNRFIIHFNEQKGENLRICFEVEKPHERLFLTGLSDYFEHFFRSFPGNHAEPKLPIANFICDFPSNRVFYHLHRLQPVSSDPFLTKILCDQRCALSQIMLEAFRDTVIDQEIIETFYLYTGLTLLQAFYTATGPSLAECLTDRFHCQMDHADCGIPESVMQQFTPLLHEMTVEIRDTGNNEAALQWLADWREFC
jgi:hypothetical protein